MTASPHDRLRELGLELPGPHPPHDPLDAVVVHRGVARTSGQLPRDLTGTIVHPGTVGDSVTVEDAAEAARWCALNALSVLSAKRLLVTTAALDALKAKAPAVKNNGAQE